MADQFDELMSQFQSIARICLFTIRIELRVHTMYFLDLAIREGNYLLETEPFGPDAYIAYLNGDLATCDEILSEALDERKVKYATLPITVFAGRVLTHHGPKICF